jgi:protein KTI12
MPLIVMCGSPCSGKTFYANKIKKYYEDKKYIVNLINEENLNADKKEIYLNNINEKNHRSLLKSEVEKKINDKTITIIDSLNYIKGSRYEFFCMVRNSKTSHCVIYVKATLEECLENNKKMNNIYSIDILKDLYSRMEEPIQNNRWDCPLYTLYSDDTIPFENINISLFEGKKLKEPISTKPDYVFDTNFLFNLDKNCQEIINEILNKQDEDIGEIILNCSEDKYITINKKFTPIQLKKIKLEFIKISKSHPPKNEKEMRKNFIEYIQTIQSRY